MTAIGKIMVVFVFLLSLVWAGMVVNTWATRTNWKAEADKQSKIAKENYDGAKSLQEQSKADRSASDAKVAALQANVDRTLLQLIEQNAQYTKLFNSYNNKLTADRASATKVIELQNDIKKVQNQVDLQSANLKTMEADLNNQIRVSEKNQNERDAAIRAANAEKQAREILVTRISELQEQLAQLNQGGKGGNARPLPPEDFRGTVQAYEDGFIEITPGLNAGLKAGTMLTIRRTKGDKNYIGTILVGQQVDPNRAVGTWIPPFGVKVPKGDDFPKKGDEVVPMK